MSNRPTNIKSSAGITDANALEQIAEILRDPDWGVGMLEDIGEIVQRTGRNIEDYFDGRSTWGRH